MRRFTRSDKLCAWAVSLVALVVYVFTLQPNTGLEDSGEFVTAAMHLGVPHPPGYPLWTIISYLFTKLVPFGNVAFRVNLVSAVFGAMAVGVFSLLTTHSLRWVLGSIQKVGAETAATLAAVGGVTAALVLAFSEVMWSQAVIAEVYTMNAFFLGLTLLLFYRWVRCPSDEWSLIFTALSLALGLTNHHTLFFIFPAFFVAVWLVRPPFEKEGGGGWKMAPGTFWDFLIACLILSPTVLYYFCHLSGDKQMERIGDRAAAISLILAGVLVFALNMRVSWRLVVGAFVAAWLGLLVYAYMPFASKTNPPMNWGYASEQAGFFHAINRGQYSDNLASLIKKRIGPVIGIPDRAPGQPAPPKQPGPGTAKKIWVNATMYFENLNQNISLPLMLLAMGVFLYAGAFGGRVNAWLWFLVAAFACLAFLMGMISSGEPQFDLQSMWVGKVFNLQSHYIFLVFMGYGAALALLHLRQTSDRWPLPAAWACVGLALVPLARNHAGCDQRERWFGWMYGTDMLRDCDKDAVIFGGTDPGRFVPTYTIFCESLQNDRWKPWLGEPGSGPHFKPQFEGQKPFDRSDLYIITQNALADGTYMKYIRSHYDVTRRARYNWFERWLGRDVTYPKKPLLLPTEAEVQQAFGIYVQRSGQQVRPGQRIVVEGVQGVFAINGIISQMIFEKNKDKHAFYVEESFPMDWYYPHAAPFGLFLKIHKDALAAIPEEDIRKDRDYWDKYSERLLGNWRFRADRPAKMSFSKLRSSIANIYAWRKLWEEAEYAYRQALRLAPENAETAFRFAEMLANLGRFDDAIQVVKEFHKIDKFNSQVPNLLRGIEERRAMTQRLAQLEAAKQAGPMPLQDRLQFIAITARLGRIPQMAELITETAGDTNLTSGHLKEMAQLCVQHQQFDACMKVLERWAVMEPGNPAVAFDLAGLSAMKGEAKHAIAHLQRALRTGGEQFRQLAAQDGRLNSIRNTPEFQRVVGVTNPAPALPVPEREPQAPGASVVPGR